MQLLRRLIALALLALWLPATLHCGLETAGLDEIFRCAEGHHDGTDTAADGCDLVETGCYKPAVNPATLLPPLSILCPFASPALPPRVSILAPESGLGEVRTAPVEVARTWQFVVRAAPPARAPSKRSV